MQQEYCRNDEEIEIDLLKIIKEIWRKLWLVILVAVILGGAMFGYGKITYVPQYQTEVLMYAHLDSEMNISSVDMFTGTCIAVLNTRKTMEEISVVSELDIPYSTLSGMISTEAVAKSPLFKITVRGTNPEEITRIANSAADILPDMVYSVCGDCEVGVIDYAQIPTAPVSSNIVRNTVIAAALGAMLVCGVIAVKVIYTDWVTFKKEKKEQ